MHEFDRVVSCSDVSKEQFEQLMKGARPFDYGELKKIIAAELPTLYEMLVLDFPNPYADQAKETDTHYILVHSMTEYFIRKTNNQKE